jgi:hypothetical protein
MLGDAVTDAAEQVADNLASQVRAQALQIGMFILSAVMVVLAVIAAFIALGYHLSQFYGPTNASLIVSAAFLAVAGLAYFLGRYAIVEPEPVEVDAEEVIEDEAEEMVDALGLTQFVLVAAAIGAAVGARVAGSSNKDGQSASLSSLLTPAFSILATVQSLQAGSDRPSADHAGAQMDGARQSAANRVDRNQR